MTTYTNPTGTFTATDGDDTIIFNAAPSSTVSVDAAGGNDSLQVQFDYATPVKFDVYGDSDGASLDVSITVDPFKPIYVNASHVENVDLHGTANNDTFYLSVEPSTSGLSVNMDGGAGEDLLRLVGTSMTTGINFVVNGSSVTSNVGTFSNFETYYILAGSGDDTITTGAGDDYVSTGTGVDHVSTGAGNDTIDVGSTGGTIDAGDGNDVVNLTLGPNSSGFAGTIDGGAGLDQLHLDWSAMTTGQSFVFNGSTFTSSLGSFAGFEQLYLTGGSGDDTITTGSGDDNISGGAGNDTISAGDGNNVISGGEGNDTITSGAGNDTIYGGHGDDTITGGDGADTIYGDENVYSTAGDGNDHIDGGAGNDTIYGGGGNDTIYGGAGNDYLVGGKGSDYIDGGDGNDTIVGYGEDGYGPDDNLPDVLIGGAGDDTIMAGYGDTVDGGTGTDQLYYNGFGGTAGINADFSKLTSGGSIVVGGATISGIEYVNSIGGTNYNDVIVAGASNGAGGLFISGYGGDDTLTGSAGHDVIDGGDGNDTLIAVGGGDTLTGGAGVDTYEGTAAGLNNAVITSLDPGERIVITDANPNTFTFSYDGNYLTYSGGSLTIGGGGNVPGKLVASAAPEGGVQIKVEPLPVATVDQIANQLTSGYWNGDSHHWAVTQGGTLSVDIHTLTPAEQTLALAALQEWTDVIGVNFRQVTSGAQIVFDDGGDATGNNPVAQTSANWANGIMTSAHVEISKSWVNDYGTGLYSYSFQTYVHEIGHALGLGHPGNYNVDATYQIGALFANDAWPMSVMSYFDQNENRYFSNQGFTYNYALTPMQADIVAMQTLYGLSTTTRSGDTTYGYHSNAGGIYDATAYPSAEFTIVDSGGNDTLDYSGFGGFQEINLNPETFSRVNGYTGNVSIARGTIIENAIGGSGIDVIIGNSADNVITGNAGADTLTGGPGNDTFKDTAAGHNGDTITDFSAGDKIVITDASLAAFAFSLSGNILTYTGGSLTLTNVPLGHLVAQAAAGGGVQLTLAQNAVPDDFNGDGHSDVLWRSDSGQLTDWIGTANGGFTSNWANAATNVALDWHVAGTGDFNGDGRSDILWRNDSGLVTEWLGTANGGFSSNWANVATNVPIDWQVVGTGDFNGDGKSDILWRSSTSGVLTDWLGGTNGSFISNYANSALSVPTNWQVVGTGDFNGDGRSDILWRDHGSGLIVDWLGQPNGGFSSNYANSAMNVPTNWVVAGTGDFNGDGHDDILWRDSANGLVTEWLGTATGGFASNWANVAANVSTDWQVAAIGDFNGDGRSDVLWRNGSGQLTDWLGTATGGFADNWAHAATQVPTSWHVQDQPFL